MKRRYLIPFSVVLSGHLLLLFGFSSPIRPVVPDADPEGPADERIYTEVDLHDPLPVADDGGDPGPQPEEAKPVPGAPEPIPHPNPLSTFITAPRPGPVDMGDIGVDRIPISWTNAGPGGEGDGSGGLRVLPAHLLDNAPTARLQAPPAYPFAARQAGRTAEVVVEFIVDERGAVLTPRVLRSSDPEFNESTLRAVAKWRFEPGRKDGRPVRFRMSVPVVFNLLR